MKLLLCKNISTLGIVGDVVDVTAGYARNYLLPHGLATEPTQANMRRLAEARKHAEAERIRERKQLDALAERLKDVEITIRARTNEEGVLYGSVGRREISHALCEEGYPIVPDQIVLHTPIRHLDNIPVEIRLAADLESTIKVWVVREKTDDELEEEADGAAAGTNETSKEASGDGDRAD